MSGYYEAAGHDTGITSIVHSRIFQYLQYWYNQYFPESFSICNAGITSIFQNLPVSAILVYLPVSAILVQILVNTSIPVSSRIVQYLQY
jgi:hypothetical protein